MKIVSYTHKNKKKEEREERRQGMSKEERGEKESILREFEFVVLYIFIPGLFS